MKKLLSPQISFFCLPGLVCLQLSCVYQLCDTIWIHNNVKSITTAFICFNCSFSYFCTEVDICRVQSWDSNTFCSPFKTVANICPNFVNERQMTRYFPEWVLRNVFTKLFPGSLVNSACAPGQWSAKKSRSVKVHADKSELVLPAPLHCCLVRHVAIQINGFQVLQSIGRLISHDLGTWEGLSCTCLQKCVLSADTTAVLSCPFPDAQAPCPCCSINFTLIL